MKDEILLMEASATAEYSSQPQTAKAEQCWSSPTCSNTFVSGSGG